MSRVHAVHLAGPLVYTRADGITIRVPAGFPAACCVGWRAQRVATSGCSSPDLERVTCLGCLYRALLAAVR